MKKIVAALLFLTLPVVVAGAVGGGEKDQAVLAARLARALLMPVANNLLQLRV